MDGHWVEPDIPRTAESISDRKERLRALGNSLVPQIAEWVGSRIVASERAERYVSEVEREYRLLEAA